MITWTGGVIRREEEHNTSQNKEA